MLTAVGEDVKCEHVVSHAHPSIGNNELALFIALAKVNSVIRAESQC